VTYPPQQPGPYDPQGGGYPQQQPGGYPANPQSGGFQQPGTGGFQQPGTGGFQQPGMGGYPPAGGGFDQQQPGGAYPPGTGGFQQPYGTGGFQQPGMGGFQPGYPGGMGPQKKSALPWILTGGGVLAVGVVVLLLFVFGVFGGGGGSSVDQSNPKTVAQAFVTAENNKDGATLKTLMCSEPTPTNVPTGSVPTGSVPNVSVQFSMQGDPTVSGNSATFKVNETINGSTLAATFKMNNNNGTWCVDPTPDMSSGGQSVGNGGGSSDSGSSDSGSNSGGSDSSDDNSSSTNSSGGSSSTDIDFEELSVGSCMSGDPDATDLSGYANADCSSSSATMKILAIYTDSTHSEFESDTLDPCNDVSDTYFPMWHGDGSGITGTIYCVGKTG